MAEGSQPKEGTPAKYPSAGTAWATVGILLLLYVTSLLDRNIITLLGENIRADLGLSDMQLSMLYGPAFAVSFALGALPLGWAMDRYSRRTVMWAGVTTWSIGTMACGLAGNFVQLFAARSLVGGGEAVMVPGSQSILADSFPKERLAFPISIYTLGSKFGQGGSLIIVGALTAIIAPAAIFSLPFGGDLRGWQLILVIVGAPGLLIALMVFMLPEPPRPVENPGSDNDVGYLQFLSFMKSNRRFFIGVLGGATMASIAVSAIMSWTPAYFIRLHGLAVGQAGYYLGLAIMIVPMIGVPLHGLIADRLYRRGIADAHLRYLCWACVLGAPLLATAYCIDHTVPAFVLFSLGYTLFMSFSVLGVVALQVVVPGQMRGKAAAILLVVTSVFGLSLGPVITAWVSEGLFTDPMRIGLALAICVGVSLPLTACFYGLAMQPLRQAHASRA